VRLPGAAAELVGAECTASHWDGDPDSDANLHANRYPDLHPLADPHANAECAACPGAPAGASHRDGDALADRHADFYADGDPDPVADRHGHTNAGAAHPHADPDPHAGR
jgi:hypothetical protein